MDWFYSKPATETQEMRYTSSFEKLGHSEAVLLSKHIKTPFRRHLVQPKGQSWSINTLVINGPTSQGPDESSNLIDPRRPTLVLTHGYGSGLGFFYANYDHLAAMRDSLGRPVQIVAIDWLGMGRSSRPLFEKRSRSSQKGKDDEQLIAAAEDYFVDSFETWREELGLETFALAGHSLGGYLSGCYALKHPQRLTSLTLISPFGLPAHPQASVPLGEVSKQLPLAQRLFLSAWNNNFTPQWVLRGMGPYGSKFASRVVARRFPAMDTNDQSLISNYLYNLSTLRPAAGEYALNALMELRMVPVQPTSHYEALERSTSESRRSSNAGTFGLFARNPLGVRLGKGLPAHMPVNILFGDNDWMFGNRNAIVSLDLIARRKKTKLTVIDGAGHHLYLDNPGQFADSVNASVRSL
ncbi:hypothetical protein CcCBS67573_g00416 [Chytriomyces confervae]|uniref:AB hydrolase-1 domain-containing protein n=1 Tax=Chytriomyces confervae TaxID=246404 RepID=A0A507FPS9_9FUNG|nr:hypothetical protein CcCBS67573_g00416 [Chytriomyces confervae]